jgi:hypothetical protein
MLCRNCSIPRVFLGKDGLVFVSGLVWAGSVCRSSPSLVPLSAWLTIFACQRCQPLCGGRTMFERGLSEKCGCVPKCDRFWTNLWCSSCHPTYYLNSCAVWEPLVMSNPFGFGCRCYCCHRLSYWFANSWLQVAVIVRWVLMIVLRLISCCLHFSAVQSDDNEVFCVFSCTIHFI